MNPAEMKSIKRSTPKLVASKNVDKVSCDTLNFTTLRARVTSSKNREQADVIRVVTDLVSDATEITFDNAYEFTLSIT